MDLIEFLFGVKKDEPKKSQTQARKRPRQPQVQDQEIKIESEPPIEDDIITKPKYKKLSLDQLKHKPKGETNAD